jgi:hypothetical protein
MRAYVMTTGAVFCLLVILHVWRVIVEGLHQAADPFFDLSTLISVTLSVWAWRVLRRMNRS